MSNVQQLITPNRDICKSAHFVYSSRNNDVKNGIISHKIGLIRNGFIYDWDDQKISMKTNSIYKFTNTSNENGFYTIFKPRIIK